MDGVGGGVDGVGTPNDEPPGAGELGDGRESPACGELGVGTAFAGAAGAELSSALAESGAELSSALAESGAAGDSGVIVASAEGVVLPGDVDAVLEELESRLLVVVVMDGAAGELADDVGVVLAEPWSDWAPDEGATNDSVTSTYFASSFTGTGLKAGGFVRKSTARCSRMAAK